MKLPTESKVEWSDRKHFMWFPWSFTKYRLTDKKLYVERGLISTKYDEVMLYRIVDVTLQRTFLQKIFGTGTIEVNSRDQSSQILLLENIKDSWTVKEFLSTAVDQARIKYRVREVSGGLMSDQMYDDPDFADFLDDDM